MVALETGLTVGPRLVLTAAVRSGSNPGRVYAVRLVEEENEWTGDPEARWLCECLGFRFGARRHLRPTCRHVKLVEAAMKDGVVNLNCGVKMDLA